MFVGYRKMLMCFAYLGVCLVLDMQALTTGADWAGIASLNGSLATGLGVVIWGNVREASAKNGG